jgi:ribosomal protein S18 acetylase RimI-like enzyme
MGSAITVRGFQGADEQKVIDVWLRSGKAAYTFLSAWQTLTRAQAEEKFRAQIRAKCTIWVALKDNDVIGYLAMKGSHIDRLYVDPTQQGTGCGTRLLNFAKAVSPDGLQLHTHQRNHRARAFYEKHGFSAVRFGMSPAPECAPDVEYHWIEQRPVAHLT